MLNLLISILGDSYGKFQIDQANVDIIEKAKNSRELQLMFFWANRLSHAKYMKICTNAFEGEGEDDQDWEGRMRFMDKRLEKIAPQIKNLDEKTSAANKSFENKIALVDTKIEETKQFFQSSIRELDKKIEANVRGLDGKLEAILKIISNK